MNNREHLFLLLTLGHAKTAVHSKSHQPVRLSAIDYGVISPQAQPIV